MKLYAFLIDISFWIAAFWTLGLGIYVAYAQKLRPAAMLFALLTILISAGIFTRALLAKAVTPAAALVFAQNGFIAGGFLPFVALWFGSHVTENQIKSWVTLPSAFLLSLFFALLSDSGAIYRAVQWSQLWGYVLTDGTLFSFYLFYLSVAWLGVAAVLSSYLLRKKNEKSFAEYNRSRYLLVSWIGVSLSLINFLPTEWGPVFAPVASLAAAFWLTLAAYALAPIRKLSLILELSRTVLIITCVGAVYGAAFIVATGLLQHLQRVVSIPIELWGLAAMTGVALVFMKDFIQLVGRQIDLLVFDNVSIQEKRLSDLGNAIMLAKNEAEYDHLLLENIHALIRPVNAHLFFRNEQEQCFQLRGSLFWGNLNDERYRSPSRIPMAAVQSIMHESAVPLERRAQDIFRSSPRAVLYETMAQLDSLYAVPIRSDKLLGIIFVGAKESGLPYRKKDLKALRRLADLTSVVAKSEQLESVQQELRSLIDKKTQELQNAQQELLSRERLAALGAAANEIAHELRNPIQVLSQATYVLERRLRDFEDDKAHRQIVLLKRQMDAMLRIIGNLLDFSRNRKLVLERVNINELVREVVELAGIPPAVRLRLLLSEELPLCMVDVQEVRQAIINLVQNAVESMPTGGTLDIETDFWENDEIVLRFSDTGCGIDPQQLEKIFEPFHSTKVRGNGIGMAVVKKVLERHHARISVDSRLGEGTRFVIHIPVALQERSGQSWFELKVGTETLVLQMHQQNGGWGDVQK